MLPIDHRLPDGRISTAAAFVACCLLAAPVAGQSSSWTVEVDLTIGEAMGGDYALTPVSDLDVDAEGRVYVAQPMDRQIRVFSADGRFVHVMGGRGGGPGEFQNIAAFGLLGDSVWASDLSREAVTWFSRQGELLRTVPWRLRSNEGDTEPGVPEKILGNGAAVASPKMRFTRNEARDPRRLPVYLVDGDHRVVRKLASIDVAKRFLAMTHSGGRLVSSYQPLRDIPLVDADENDGKVVVLRRPAAEDGGPARFSLSFYSPDGDSIGAWAVRYRPVPVTGASVERYVDRAASRLTQGRARLPEGEAEEIAREALYLPDFHPPVSEMVVGREGTIWLRRERTGERDRWEAYGEEGEKLGQLSIDRDIRILAAEGDVLWGARRTEAGVPQVVRLAIRRERGG